MQRLAEIYYSGRGVAVNKTETIKWYQKARRAGDAEAQKKTGRHDYNNGDGTKKDYAAAMQWYQKAGRRRERRGLRRGWAPCICSGNGVKADNAGRAENGSPRPATSAI